MNRRRRILAAAAATTAIAAPAIDSAAAPAAPLETPPADDPSTTTVLVDSVVDDSAAVAAAHHWRFKLWHYQRLLGRDLFRLGRNPGCDTACRWNRARVFHIHAHTAHRHVDQLRHGPAAACYALVARRFAPYGWSRLATAVVSVESSCRWNAENAESTAAGPWQFLDFWGTLAHRMDVVWSTDRALRAWIDQGGPCPAWSESAPSC